jgi:DNA-binding response OmpR family regulator
METGTVLVLDDDRTFTGLLKTVFELEGYQAAIISDQNDLMQAARQIKPVLLVMDVHTGCGDTVGVLQELKSDETTRTIPVIMTSGMDRRDECLRAGADTFILKPFRPSELLQLVEELLGKQGTSE